MVISPRAESELSNLLIKAKTVLNQLGYSNIAITDISLNGRLSKTLGRYFVRKNAIEINKDFFLYGKEHDVTGVIIHEIIHSLAPKCLHDGKWLEIAADVANRTDYKFASAKSKVEKYYKPKKHKYEHHFQCKCGYKQSVKSKFEVLPQRYAPSCILIDMVPESAHDMRFVSSEKIFKYL